MIIITSTVVVLDCDSKVTQYCSIPEINAHLNKLIKMTIKALQRYLENSASSPGAFRSKAVWRENREREG